MAEIKQVAVYGTSRITGNATVNETLVVLRPADKERASLLIQNLGPGVLYIGNASLTTANGIKLGVDESISFDSGINDPMYAHSVGSCDVRYMEESI